MSNSDNLEMRGCMPDDVTDEALEDLAEKARDYMLSHGHLMRTKANPGSQNEVTYAPFTLFPYPVPDECFKKACRVQQSYNLLIHKVAHDHEFLEMCLSKTIKADEFTRKLWDVYQAVRKEGRKQLVSLGMNRCDYMMDTDGDGEVSIKQLEMNTMAAAGANMACNTSNCHRYLLQSNSMVEWADKVPENKGLQGLAEGMAAAWTYYNNPKSVILFLIEKLSTNLHIYDQRMLEYLVHDINPDIRIIRKTLTQMHRLTLEGPDRKLYIDENEVAIVYQRWGYSPDHFTCDKDWTARLDMERSLTMVCPTIGYHLAGTKKVQQVLSEPGMLERFFSDPEEIKLIRDTFTGNYSLDKSPAGDLALEMARNNPDRYVIKPQREGGGNNTFGRDISELLDRIENTDERNGYVMMDLIRNSGNKNIIIRSHNPLERVTVVGELGIYGAFLGSADKVFLNTYCGHLVKCKPEDSDEGAIFGGRGAFSSVVII